MGECAKEGGWCECPKGTVTFGDDELNWIGKADGSRRCITVAFGIPQSELPSNRKCFCLPESAVTSEPTRLTIETVARCSGDSVPMLQDFSLRNIDLTQLDMDINVKLWGWMNIADSWMDASAMLLPVVKSHLLGPYVEGLKQLPVI